MYRRIALAAACLTSVSGVLAQTPLKSQVYGYIEGYVEKNEKTPGLTRGTANTPAVVKREKSPHEFDTPNITLMVKSTYMDKYSAFLNLASPGGEEVKTRNAWVEQKLAGDSLKMRIGKLYRPFDLYNELLDAVPTYIGIEPPEHLDKDHLLVSRTTNFMLHGEQQIGSDLLRYAITTGNDEKEADQLPVGGDLRYTKYGEGYDLTLGLSGYRSNGRANGQDVDADNRGGVAAHIVNDNYNVLGGYTEFNTNKWKIQAAYYMADHDGTRNGKLLREWAGDELISGMNQRQLDRICGGDCATAGYTEAKYKIETWYFRSGYSIQTDVGQFVPYVQFDYYHNPEMIANKDIGGDNEAGHSDDGRFTKQTLGLVYRPIPAAALKLDTSNHNQKMGGTYQNYVEGRFSYSYIWTL